MGVKIKGNYKLKTDKTTGDYLVRFFDFDGTILKEQWVNSGEDATAPDTPTHEYLTFAEWNNDFVNVTNDIDVGAIYNTTDGKTHVILDFPYGMTPTVSMYFYKYDSNPLTVNWGDGSVEETTTGTGTVGFTKTYDTVGSYNVTVDSNSVFDLGSGISSVQFLGPSTELIKLREFYMGNTCRLSKLYFFDGANRLIKTSLSNSSNFTTIQRGFGFCYSLTHLNIPKNVTSFGSSTFFYNYNMQIIIPSILTSIGQESFWNNYGLKSLTLYNIGYIGTNAFASCYNLKYIMIHRTTPPTVASLNAFSYILADDFKIYVPDSSLQDYKDASQWINIKEYIYPISDYYNNR